MKYQDYIEHEAFIKFKNSAERFFEVVEFEGNIDDHQYKKNLHYNLSELYTNSWKLPELELMYDSDLEDLISSETIQIINEKIADNIGGKAFYFEVFDPSESGGKEASQGLLVDDVSDIYKELKNGFMKIEVNEPKYIEDGIWDIVFGRNTHWGHHAINALRALHFVTYG